MGIGDIPQGGTARQVGPVHKMLYWHPCPFTDQREPGGGNRVRGVLLVGIMLDHHAPVHIGPVLFVELFGMVRMYRVRVVRRNHEASGNSRTDLSVGSAQRKAEPRQRVIEE